MRSSALNQANQTTCEVQLINDKNIQTTLGASALFRAELLDDKDMLS